MQEYSFKAPAEDTNKRLDVLIMESLKRRKLGFSRTAVQAAIAAGKVWVNGSTVKCAHHKIKGQEDIKIILENKKAKSVNQSENIPLEIVYEDEDIAVINKPIGLVTHPAPGNYEHTLVNALLYKFASLSDINPDRPGIVHRLDKDTSGLLVIAKNNFAHLNLAEQFSRHSIKRKYIALVSGKMEFDENIIEMPIGRHPRKRKEMAVGFGKNTKYARTAYHTLKRSSRFSLVELEPFTGRTHQLRVHMAFLGHPILGDSKYGKEKNFKRLALHAVALGFIHPRSGKFIEFSSDIPAEFLEIIK